MPRKKKETAVSEEVPVALPVEQNGDTVTTNPPDQATDQPAHASNGNGGRRPVISWRVMSDRTTSIELACWSNTYRAQSGEEYEQLTFTVNRSYKTDEGWQRQEKPSWRAHDIPVLMFLLSKAHSYALDNRTTVTPETPF
jgi:hypothetical protein